MTALADAMLETVKDLTADKTHPEVNAPHAQYSPSASVRWMKCPGSIHMINTASSTESEHTVYTASGTVIHAVAELWLTKGKPSVMDQRWGDYAKVGSFNDELVTAEMFQQADDYIMHIESLKRPGDVMLVEKRLVFSEALFGTVDVVLYNHERIAIIDLKTGVGNMVNPEDNYQLLTYGAMFLHKHAKVIPPEMHMVIIQPPDNIQLKLWATTPARVEEHLEAVKVAMEATHLCAGVHCKWCPVRASCPELRGMAEKAQTIELDGLNPEQWAEALHFAEVLKPWCGSVFDRANQLVAEEGLQIPGYKMVEKRGRRTWVNEKEAEFKIVEMLEDVDLLETPEVWNPAKLRTPLQVIKACKKIIPEAEIKHLTHVKHSGNILVPDTDKREAVVLGSDLISGVDQIELSLLF